jgi:uncharacterized protein (TIGR02266 family)
MAEASSTEDVVTLRIRFKSETVEKFAERYAADLGPDEVFVRTREPLAVGTPLQFDFTLNDGSPLLAGRGTVTWSREPNLEAARTEPAGMGIRFEVLSTTSRLMLGRILDAKARLARHTPAAGAPAMATTAVPGVSAANTVPTPVAPAPPPTVPMVSPFAATAEQPRSTPRSPMSASAADLPSARPTPAMGVSVTAELPRPVLPGATGKAGAPARADAGGRGDKADKADRADRADKVHRADKAEAGAKPGGGGGKAGKQGFASADEDAERTEIAKMPPSFYYENAEDDAGTSPVHDGANLLDDLDDITSPRAEIPGVTRTAPPKSPEPPIAWKPTKSPPAGSLGAALRGPLSATAPAPRPVTGRPAEVSPPPGERPRFTGGVPVQEDSAHGGRVPAVPHGRAAPPAASRVPPAADPDDLFQPPPQALPSHIGQPPPSLPMDPGMSMPSVPSVSVSAPAWPADSGDALDVPTSRRRGGTGKTWLALALAAGAVVVGALWVFPRVMNRGAQVGSAEPVATADPAAPPPAIPGAPPAALPPAAAVAPASAPTPPAGAPPPAAPAAAGEPPKAAPGAAAAPVVAQAPPPAAAAPAAAPTPPPARPARRIRNVGPLKRSPPPEPRAEAESPPPVSDPVAAAGAPPGAAGAPPPAAEPGADEVFWLSVRSTPPGADVLIDGQVEGKTPFQRRIFDPNRSYALTIRKPGFEDIERSLGSSDQWVKRGNTRTLTVNARLSPSAAAPAEPAATAPATPSESKPTEPPPVPAERKSNPFDEPAPTGGPQ